jgi:hypothetical protein
MYISQRRKYTQPVIYRVTLDFMSAQENAMSGYTELHSTLTKMANKEF